MPDNHISFENKDYYIELGLNIAFYRKRAGLTQDMLAEKAGLSRSHLSAIEAPNIIRSFSLEILFHIARALDVEPYRLLQFRD
ncbi:helix-turn-helix domain-containing protein [Acetatifactor aquisgranensis]|uniref:helix-turn-helix domain-containing protein n=1 Tax=Acetatifactor aquisgranensis TaxID=2941233 RepID=UPI0020409210|nr:helix-turn-helix transcriptional regulator [Acetatifactor aquisgranensis]